jgi:hypothetical protein
MLRSHFIKKEPACTNGNTLSVLSIHLMGQEKAGHCGIATPG